jgi:Skp family chaperone for outer membrane proteins
MQRFILNGTTGLSGRTRRIPRPHLSVLRGAICAALALFAFSFATVTFAGDMAKDSPGFVTEIPANESDVLLVVKEVAADTLVRGTYVYEKDKTLTGAIPAKTSAVFGAWQGPGTVFYKVLPGALAPRHFADSSDIGTITVRYVVQAVDEARTRVRVDAVFIEDARRKAHLSDGTVETSESKAIQDKLQEVQLAGQQAAEELASRQQASAAEAQALRERQDRQEEAARLDAAQSSIPGLEQRLRDLRHQAELRVKDSHTPLKSAPFAKAADLQTLGAYTELVVLIVTPYWYGVEIPDGHRGWVRRDQAEALP